MTVLYIILGVIGFVSLILLFVLTGTVRVRGSYETNVPPELKVTFRGITVFDINRQSESPPKSAEKSSKKSRKKPAAKTPAKNSAKPEKPEKPEKPKKSAKSISTNSLADTLSGFKLSDISALKETASPYLRRLLAAVRVRNLFIVCVAGGENAAAAAINYGIYNAAVYNALTFFPVGVKPRRVEITCDFGAEKTDWQLRGDVVLSTLTLAGIALEIYLKSRKGK
ncbi:hypothetical protein FACS189499_00220 [Clostridia bacterium]|nr:hypothetical protein FACS189499_00220 [Clostridia bacterium]